LQGNFSRHRDLRAGDSSFLKGLDKTSLYQLFYRSSPTPSTALISLAHPSVELKFDVVSSACSKQKQEIFFIHIVPNVLHHPHYLPEGPSSAEPASSNSWSLCSFQFGASCDFRIVFRCCGCSGCDMTYISTFRNVVISDRPMSIFNIRIWVYRYSNGRVW
jgi:hypothetical protein